MRPQAPSISPEEIRSRIAAAMDSNPTFLMMIKSEHQKYRPPEDSPVRASLSMSRLTTSKVMKVAYRREPSGKMIVASASSAVSGSCPSHRGISISKPDSFTRQKGPSISIMQFTPFLASKCCKPLIRPAMITVEKRLEP